MPTTTLPSIDDFMETVDETSINADTWRNLEIFSVKCEAAIIAVDEYTEEKPSLDVKDTQIN